MQSGGSAPQRSQRPAQPAPCAPWTVELKLTHLDWSPEAALVHFQAQNLTICEQDYNMLQGEIQSAPKTQAAVDSGELCLVEDVASARWFRGRVQTRHRDLLDIFLIDYGNVLSVNESQVSSCSDDLLTLPPKIVSGFLANVLLLQTCSQATVEKFLSSLIGTKVWGHVHALLPYQILLLEAPDINGDLVKHGFGRHMDTDTFLLLVQLLTDVSVKQNTEPVPAASTERPGGREDSWAAPGLQRHRDMMWACQPRLSCGTRVKVRVTAAVNARLFHCQMADKTTDAWEMSKKLAAVCESKTRGDHQQAPENVGSLCAVKGKDGRWYRGHVQCLPINSLLRVFFVDHGYFESVKVENIHSLPPDLCSTPIMAFRCSFSRLSRQDEAVNSQQLSFLKAGLLGGVLDVEISSFDEEEHLYTITLIGSADDHVEKAKSLEGSPQRRAASLVEASTRHAGHLNYEKILEAAFGKALEEEDVQRDSVFVGYVEHIQHPNRFWIRTQKRNQDFQEMMTNVRKHFSQVKLEDDVLLNPEPGTACCAVFETDMHFYRGVVTDTLRHGAQVHFLDFGNTEKVPHQLIKKMPEEFAGASAFAFCCSLNVIPTGEDWTSAASDIFRQMVSHEAVLVRVLQKRKNKCVVDLHQMGQENAQSIADLLVSQLQAESNETHEPVAQSKLGPVTPGGSGSPRQPEEDSCKEAHSPVGFSPLNMGPGREFAVRCSHVESAADFWCQPQEKLPALEALMEKIQDYYSTKRAPLQTGALCCAARSPSDGRWHRALIMEKHRDQIRVMLVDYGSTIQVQEKHLQAIMPEFAELERQAFRCTFSHLVRPAHPGAAGTWSMEVDNSVRKFVLDSSAALRCQVVSKVRVKNRGRCHVVELYDGRTQQSLSGWLLQRGLAAQPALAAHRPSAVSPETFVYSDFGLSPGMEEQVYVTHVCSQWDFYCHLERNSDIIQELEQNISQECEKASPAGPGAAPRNVCLAKYLDGRWYRGLARPVQSARHLGVFFVDYGNKSVTEKSGVVSVPRDSAHLLYTPMQAVRCRLASVSKEELYARVKEWLDGTILNKQLKVLVRGKNEDGSFDVTLFDGDTDINEKAEELVLGLAPKPRTDVKFENVTEMKKQMSPRKVDFRSPFKGKLSPSNPHRGARGGEEPQKRKRHRPQSRDSKVGLQNKNITEESARVQQRSHAQERTAKVLGAASNHPGKNKQTGSPGRVDIPDRTIAAGLRAKCFVSHVNSVNSFFLHLSEDEASLLRLGEELNSPALTPSLRTATSLRVKDFVLAVYEADGALYRSVVTNIRESSRFTVEFVDYGNTATVKEENMHQIPAEFLRGPRLSVPCRLRDSGAFESDAAFADAVLEKPVTVDFVCQNGTLWEVRVEALGGEPPEAVIERFPEKTSANLEQEETRCDTEDMTGETSEKVVEAVQGQRASPKTKVKFQRVRDRRRPAAKTRWIKKDPRKPNVKRLGVDSSGPKEIQPKDRESGTILSVQSNGEFFVRLARSRSLLDKLERCIADNLHRCEVAEHPRPGLRCVVQLKGEDPWHRAAVRSVAQDKCRVLLVDHGVTEEVQRASIRRQCDALSAMADLALPCRVNGLGFDQGEDAASSWFFTLKPMVGRDVDLEFVSFSEADGVWMVEVVVDGLFLICRTRSQQVPPFKSERHRDATDRKVDAGPPQHLPSAPVDTVRTYSASSAAALTPFAFCVVLETSLPAITELEEEVAEQLAPIPDQHLVRGTSLLLKSGSRNGWCRAEVVSASSTTLLLLLVDHGQWESVPHEERSRLRRLPQELLQVPKVSCPCSLRGVNPAADDKRWSREAAAFFRQSLDQKKLQIFFREFVSNTHWMVDILSDGVHVAKKLVDAGHADYVDVALGLRFQEVTAPPVEPRRQPEAGKDAASDPEVSEEQEEEGGAGALHTSSGSSPCSVM